MSLSITQQKEILDKVSKYVKKCPMCHKRKFVIFGSICNVKVSDKVYIPSIMVICEKCGNMQFHNSGTLDLNHILK